MSDEIKNIDIISRFLSSELDCIDLGEHEDLFLAGIESIQIIRLVSFLENKFGIEIPPSKMNYDNFHTISSISKTIKSIVSDHE